MHHIMIAGAGKIGSLIACLLAGSGDYQVYIADIDFSGIDIRRLLHALPQVKTVALNVTDEESTQTFLLENKIHAIISSLPYFLNPHVARAAKVANAHYFDLTEDIQVTAMIKHIANDADSAFVPQCGLAPGFISIAANSLMKEFDQCFHAKLRVGALPQRSNNSLHYSLTWSTDGLINEYGNLCHAIEASMPVVMHPLEGLESIEIEGCEYEAFNTSGGLGSLSELYQGTIQTLNYKTIRYPGHCEKMRFLMNDLKLNADRPMLKTLLERAIPKTGQDFVMIYVAVEGLQQGELIEKSYLKKIYPLTIHHLEWSAIQISTAAGVCSVVDLVLQSTQHVRGLLLQEHFCLSDVLENRFGRYYAQ